MTVLVPGLKALSNTKITRLRELPIPGDIAVTVGQQVVAGSIIGRANLPGELLVLRLPELMGLQVFEVLKALQVQVGDSVASGQLLAEYSGLFGLLKTRYHASEDGVIEFFSERTAHLGLRKAAWPIEVNAYISGVVSTIDPHKSCEIECDCSFIQGIFGLGGERSGTLKVVAKADQELTPELIPADCADCILVGGMNPSIATIEKALSAGAKGIITGSLDDRLIKAYLGYDLGIAITGDEDVPLTLIMTEGFGRIPISDRVFKLLMECDGLPASINGATQVRAGAVRPEIIIPRQSTASDITDEQGLSVGRKVRVIRVPFFGQLGEVLELPVKMQKIETGAFARVVSLRLSNNETVIVPRANVELI